MLTKTETVGIILIFLTASFRMFHAAESDIKAFRNVAALLERS